MMKMLRVTRVASSTVCLSSRSSLARSDNLSIPFISQQNPYQRSSVRFLDIYQFVNKAAIEKERKRLSDELSRGYFADMSEMKEHGGKIAMANKIIIPAIAAVKFPALEVNHSNSSSLKLPITCYGKDSTDANVRNDHTDANLPRASLLCLSFRASSEPMIHSWSVPFVDAFKDSNKVHLYEISFVDSWLLSRNPIKKLLLHVMRKPKPEHQEGGVLQRRVAYSFGDHYEFRKELKILNLLTGYIYLVDKHGRIRWQGCGSATQEEILSLLSCTSLLLEEG
ncbi:unnamed protein product [Cuscuta europaea]|uniref:AT1G08220-like protein n=1 Tax=Cuscuta europaea TaxID=41803 RepID=A0A9P0YP07_CUSEU|nr:unnamed protein product [Cuscuta europaea]